MTMKELWESLPPRSVNDRNISITRKWKEYNTMVIRWNGGFSIYSVSLRIIIPEDINVELVKILYLED